MIKLLTICLLMATLFTVHAQDGKPTKEQTVEYLKSVLLRVEGGYNWFDDGEVWLYRLSEMELNGCILKVGFEGRRSSDKLKNNWTRDYDALYEIDLSQVESFRFITSKTDNSKKPYNDNLELRFATKESKNLEVIGFYCSPEYTEKVLKALNHLRKLCNAPEPISFD